jgi:uncharacterized membrane protein YhaH (DUF805 family)
MGQRAKQFCVFIGGMGFRTCVRSRAVVLAHQPPGNSSGARKESNMNWYLEVLKKYAVVSGRARRREYWYFVLFNLIIFIILTIIDYAINSAIISTIYSLAVLIPSIAVGVRRLHDTNRTGWWLLIGLIPIIGWIVLIIFMVQDSQKGENQYGPNPKGAAA